MSITIVLNPLGSTEVWNVSTQQWDISTEIFSGEDSAPNLIASASDFGDITIGFTGIPEITVERTSNNASIELVNTEKYDIRIYRADDHREVFYQYISNVNSASPFTDNAIWNTYAFQWDSNNVDYDEFSSSKNYKYKASFVASGTKGGSPISAESQTSDPVYTVGNKTL